MSVDLTLLSKCKQDFDLQLYNYQKMQSYYNGQTDAMINYQMITDRANNKINCNFIQKFINEESSYCCGNKITYTSHSGNSQEIEDIRNNFRHWSEKHDKELCKQALIFQSAYELYYIDSNGLFNSMVCTPLNSYALQDYFGNIQFFIRFFTKKFDDSKTLYADVYADDKSITHYTVMGSTFTQIPDSKIDSYIFSKVPVSVVNLGSIYEGLFNKIKGLEDGYETILSDICNEISDFRNAYLTFSGCELNENQLKDMKKNGIINLPNKDSVASWMIKQINDSFIQNTLTTLEDKIYQLSCHINHNEKLASNTSSLALRNRLISLEQKCTDNIQSLTDCIKLRIQFLFEYLKIKNGNNYLWTDIDIKFTPNIPTDDLMMAQIISQLNGKLPIKTGLKQLSFVDNPDAEMAELKKEQQESGMINLDNVPDSTKNTGGAVNG